ncbi:ankyrin [Fusarium albosuccineum]|uniref:Ankyrin n=1 Tax=Fusarium albosuccineum TaxID=1237068 RepID=A0A8H4PHF4_9HYPO|nr:ankyrin [Fusarium albosuccineum]
MAEALGIAGSVIAVVGAAIKTTEAILGLISRYHDAPAEIVFLQNDVADTQLILANINDNISSIRHVEHRLGQSGSNTVFGSLENHRKASYLLKRLELSLLDIEDFLMRMFKSKPLARVIDRAAWILHRGKIKTLQQNLHEVKDNVSLYFSASARYPYTMFLEDRNLPGLKPGLTLLHHVSTQASRSCVLLTKILCENDQNIRRQTERYDQLDEALQHLAQRLAGLSTVPERQAQLISLMENFTPSVISQEQRSSQVIISTTTDGCRATGARADVAAAAKVAAPQSSEVTTTSSIQISTESAAASWVANAIAIKGGVIALHLSRRESLARPSSESPVYRYYQGPVISAFLSRMISLVYITTTQGDPALCLKVRPLSTDFSIYRAVERHDVKGVQHMLEHRTAHPSASFKGGWTPLHYAISYGYTAIIKSLLAVGADPLLQDGTNQLSPLEWAWTKILGGAYDRPTQVEMEQLFSDKDCLEEMRFPRLHRITLGLDQSSLKKHLSNSPETIDFVDASGRTALSWAAQRGMTSTVETLLRFGADPNINTPNGHSPLMFASEARNSGGIRLLLDAGADVRQCDVEGQTALHYAAGHWDDLAYYRPLIEHGSDPNWPTIPRLTPLTTVIIEGHNEAMKYLVANGAKIDLNSHDERTPGFFAVEYNNYTAIEYLHEQGVDFKGYSKAYPSVVHVAAYHADVRTLTLLTTYRLTLEDIDCVDSQGLTVPQIVDQRLKLKRSVENGFVQAFELFLKSVRDERLGGILNLEPDNEIFYDAEESM